MKKHRLLVSLLLGAILIISHPLPATESHAASPAASSPRESRLAPWLMAPTALQAAARALGAALAELPASYGSCSKLVYQSYLGDQWEIMFAKGDGTAGTRLTHSSYDNTAPSLSPGCDQIVFGSTRSGQQNVYLMDVDGSNVRQLTSSTAGDMLPVFSPDGTKVAFQTYRDGSEPEVYVLNLNNNQLTRLTNDAAYDGQPDWSPDGSKIAFISGRSGTKNVWVMNSDGGNQHRLTDLPYCGGPNWSPDGARIAFAGDESDSGYTSVWVMDSDGSDSRLIYDSPTLYHDAWPGAWSTDGKYIMYEEADWSSGLVSSRLDVVDPDNVSDRQTVVSGGSNMSPDWKAQDDQPPSSKINTLPTQATQTIVVTWSGWDSCSASIEYQVQYRIGGWEDWVDWPITPGASWTTATQASFAFAEPGTAYFRCRARDQVGNIEAWPGGMGDASTSYAAPPPVTDIMGYVFDVRGHNLYGAGIALPPGQVAVTTSLISGRFLLSVEDGLDDEPTVRDDGFAVRTLPPLWCGGATPLLAPLATEPEALANGGFESGHAAWYASPNTAFDAATFAYGNRVARLGYAMAGGQGAADPAAGQISEIQQTVTLPAAMRYPTLSFLYVLGDGATGQVGQAEVYIDQGATKTLVASLTTPSAWYTDADWGRYPAWRFVSVNLDAWAGKTITLRFRYSPNWTYQFVLLDAVSISAWRTPEIQTVSPRIVTPGAQVTLMIGGTNLNLIVDPAEQRSAQVSLGGRVLTTTHVANDVIRATVPSTMSLGMYDLIVTNPAGYVGARAAAVSVGGFIALPLTLRNSH